MTGSAGNKKRKGKRVGPLGRLAQDGFENFKSFSIFPDLIQNKNKFKVE
jgi:hypothetical protein